MKLVAFHRPASILCAVGGTWIWFRHHWEGESVTILSRVDLGLVECNAADLGAFSEPRRILTRSMSAQKWLGFSI